MGFEYPDTDFVKFAKPEWFTGLKGTVDLSGGLADVLKTSDFISKIVSPITTQMQEVVRDAQVRIPSMIPSGDLGILQQSLIQTSRQITDMQATMFEASFDLSVLNLADAVSPMMERIGDIMSSYRSSLLAASQMMGEGIEGRFREAFYAPNWRGIGHEDLALLIPLSFDEALPITWVPSADTLGAFLTASSEQERRDYIGRHSRQIVDGCRESLDEVDSWSRRFAQLDKFAQDAFSAFDNGHSSAAQALATNVLDSLIWTIFSNKRDRSAFFNSSPGNREGMPELAVGAMRMFTASASMIGSHARFQIGKDPVPRTYNRHATSHSVTGKQYTKINAVVALMQVTSAMRLAHDMRRRSVQPATLLAIATNSGQQQA